MSPDMADGSASESTGQDTVGPPPPAKERAARLRWAFEHRWDCALVIDASTSTPRFGETVNDAAKPLGERDTFTEPTYTGQDLLGLALDAADLLSGLDVQSGDIVAVRIQNGIEVPALLLAAMARRATLALLDPVRSPDQVREMLDQINPLALLGDVEPESVPEADGSTRVDSARVRKAIGTGRRPSLDELAFLDDVGGQVPCLVTFTSGSTGRPKGVVHSSSNLIQSAAAFARPFRLGRDRTLLHVLPMAFMAGVLNGFVLPLLEGWRIVLGERFGIQTLTRFWPVARRHNVDTFWLVPAIPALLLQLDREPCHEGYGQERDCVGFVGTAPLDPTLARRFTDRYDVPLYESYGLSEVLFLATDHPGRRRHDNVGTPLEGVDLKILNDGEIGAAAPWRFLGYTSTDDEPHLDGAYLRTGDLGRIEEDGSLTITGRKKDLIIRGGVNIAPRSIEDVLLRLDGVGECAIVGAPDEHLGERIVCFYVTDAEPDPDGSLSHEGLLDEGRLRQRATRALVETLGPDHRVDDVVPVKELPRNPNGKVDRDVLRAKAARRSGF